MGTKSPHVLTSSKLLLALLFLYPTFALAESPLVDPINWAKPVSPPEFRERIHGKEYQQRFQQALKEIGSLEDLKVSTAPSVGVEIVNMTPGDQADALGIRLGDVITHCNGDVLWIGNQLSSYEEEDWEVRLVTSGGEVRTLDVQPGKLGAGTAYVWRPEIEYVRSDDRDPRWDREVIVGLWKSSIDPELAETCWAHAVAAGYLRDHRSEMSGAVIALHSDRPNVAADFAFSCLDTDDVGPEIVHPHVLFRLAMANYKLKHALEIMKRHPMVTRPEFMLLLKQLVSLHEARSVEDRCVSTPSQLADQMYRDDFRKRAMPLNAHPSVESHVDRLRSSPQSDLTAATANFALAVFGPPLPAKNIDLQIRFRLKATDSDLSGFLKIFECGLIDVEHQGYLERFRRGDDVFLFAGIQDGGVIRASAAGLAKNRFVHDRTEIRQEQEHTIRLVRVGGQGEVFVNGTRMLYAPLYDDVDFVAVMLKSVGMEVEILDLKVMELIERL